MTTRSIARQLRDAWIESGLSLEELLAKSKLELDISSFSRKLAGKQVMRIEEAEAIAVALKSSIELTPTRGARAS